jgi:hypothetical protein
MSETSFNIFASVFVAVVVWAEVARIDEHPENFLKMATRRLHKSHQRSKMETHVVRWGSSPCHLNLVRLFPEPAFGGIPRRRHVIFSSKIILIC